MAKRPSIIDQMDLAPVTPTADAGRVEPPEVPTTAKPRVARPDVQHTSVYIPRQAYERLREIAFSERRKIHDLIMEGIDRTIEDRGHPERTGRSTKAAKQHSATARHS